MLGLVRLFRRQVSPAQGSTLVTADTDRATPAGTETVLVVEDDRAVRLLFTKVLESAGYEVIACENGTVGLEAARNQIEKIDAIITDARMPGMQGPRLIKHIRALRPEIPAILVSGNAVDTVMDPATVFLSKPISPGILTRELRRLLLARM
ncbi:MAG: response regulator [Acidobacteriaceae bacterium]